MRTFVELRLLPEKGADKAARRVTACVCKNVSQWEAGGAEEEMAFDTRCISVEEIVWAGATRTSLAIVGRLTEKVAASGLFERAAVGLGLSMRGPHSPTPLNDALAFSLAGNGGGGGGEGWFLKATVDVCTGRLLLSLPSRLRANARIMSKVRRFNRKHADMLASVAEVLASEHALSRLVGKVVSLVEHLHASLVLDAVGGLALRLRPVERSEQNGSLWEAAGRALALREECRDAALFQLGGQGEEVDAKEAPSSLVAFVVRDGLEAHLLRVRGAMAAPSVEGKDALGSLPLSPSLLSAEAGAGAGAGGERTKKRKLGEDDAPAAEAGQGLPDFVAAVLSKL